MRLIVVTVLLLLAACAPKSYYSVAPSTATIDFAFEQCTMIEENVVKCPFTVNYGNAKVSDGALYVTLPERECSED